MKPGDKTRTFPTTGPTTGPSAPGNPATGKKPENKHDSDARRRLGKEPKPAPEMKHEKQTEKGSGEGVTGMQRGAGHPTGR